METEDLQARFHSYFLEYGGRFDYQATPLPYEADFGEYLDLIRPSIHETARTSIKRLPKGNTRIYMDYINSTDINAAATPLDGNTYYIGINSGVVYLLERLFNTMLANPMVLPTLGKASSEVVVAKIDVSHYTDIKTLVANSGTLVYPKPIDGDRAAIVKFLTLFALSFLAYHELTHILNGHVDYLYGPTHLRRLQETQFSSDQLEDFLLSQTLEYDADVVGFCSLINFVIHISQKGGSLPIDSDNVIDNLGLAGFAVYYILRIFGNDVPAGTPLTERSYPPFAIRRKVIIEGFVTLMQHKTSLGRFDKDVEVRLTNAVAKYFVEAERAFDIVGKNSTGLNVKADIILDEAGREHMRLLNQNWAKLRPLLQPHAYGDLVP